MMARLVAAASALALVASGCALLKDPIEPWQVDVTLGFKGEQLMANPPELKVDGPFGFVVVTNDSNKLIGFAIDELAVYEKINPDATTRLNVDELEDDKTYTYYDFVNDKLKRKTPVGTIVVNFVAESER